MDTTNAERSPKTQREIAALLLQAIKKGEFAAGDRLPVRAELIKRYNSTAATVQRAVDLLMASGNLVTKPRHGTFVANAPPCLDCYGLVFPSQFEEKPVAGLFPSLVAAARGLEKEGRRRFTYYTGMDERGRAGEGRVRVLLDDIALGRVAGLIFASPPHYLMETEIVSQSDVPCVSIQPPRKKHDFATVELRGGNLVGRALDYAMARGCSRFAAIVAYADGEATESRFHKALAERGLFAPKEWVQAIGHGHSYWARNAVRLLLRQDAGLVPDALLILNDTLTPETVAGIEESGLAIGTNVTVVSHCNFISPKPSTDGVFRLGYDMRELLLLAVSALQRQQTGEKRVPHATVEVRTEEELELICCTGPAA